MLDGSVRRTGDRIRVSAELTSAGEERVIWSQTYERSLADVFAVQDEITRQIVAAPQLRLVSAGGAGGMSARGGTTNFEAYDLYLRALPLYKGRGSGLLEAERYLVEAVSRDPDDARAHAMLASTLLAQPYFALRRYCVNSISMSRASHGRTAGGPTSVSRCKRNSMTDAPARLTMALADCDHLKRELGATPPHRAFG